MGGLFYNITGYQNDIFCRRHEERWAIRMNDGMYQEEENDYFGDSEEDFLKDMLGCDDEYTLDDFFDSFDPD